MTVSFGNSTGDGIYDIMIRSVLQMPDSGNTAQLEGLVQSPGSPVQVFSQAVTCPSVPGSGSIFWNIQVDYTAGTVSVQQSTVSDPAALANNVVIFRQTLTFGTSGADLALDPSSTPDTY